MRAFPADSFEYLDDTAVGKTAFDGVAAVVVADLGGGIFRRRCRRDRLSRRLVVVPCLAAERSVGDRRNTQHRFACEHHT